MSSLFSEFDLKEEELESVEQQIGINPEQVIDRTEKDALQDREAENVIRYLEGDKVLQSSSQISEEQLAHESVHAAMMNENNGKIELFGEDKLDWRLYAEFAAYTAQDIVGEVEVNGSDKIEYFVARKGYMDAQEKAIESGLPDTDSLYQEFLSTDEIEDETIKQEFSKNLHKYRDSREQTLTAYAAKKYREQNDVSIQEIINPDRQTYDDVIDFIKNSEKDLLGG